MGDRLESSLDGRGDPGVRLAVPRGARTGSAALDRGIAPTRFWFVRHAPVAEAARRVLYGTMDVALSKAELEELEPLCHALARALPRPATWVVSPLSRTRLTAEAIFAAGYPKARVSVEPGFIEQRLGAWQGLTHAELAARLSLPAAPFWPLPATERPPGGESVSDLIARVGPALEHTATENKGKDVIVVGHGGAIRAAIAYALGVDSRAALAFSIRNLSLTRLERYEKAWRVVSVNELLTP